MNESVAIELIKQARKTRDLTQMEVAEKIAERLGQGYSLRQYQKLEAGEFPKYKEKIIIALEEILDIKIIELIYAQNNPTQYISEPGELIYVSAAAQNKYPAHFKDPAFINNLPQVRLPDVTYQGEQYRVFEVKKDSMMRHLVGDFLIGNKIELYPPLQIINYGLYIVVYQTEIVMGWLAIKSENDGIFVLQSLNRHHNKQILISLKDIKELWYAERIIHIIEPVIRRFNIEI